jgi:excisionase family DNA binding protein
MDVKDYLTVKQIAKKIGLTEERVRELINLRQIRGTKIGRWYVKPEDLGAFVRKRTNKKKGSE